MGNCPWMGPTAIDAWSRWPAKHVTTPKRGDFAFYGANASNEDYGHVGVVTAVDQMASVTFYGVRTDSIGQWSQDYAVLLGYQRWW